MALPWLMMVNIWLMMVNIWLINMVNMGVSENVVHPIVPNGFADHYPVFKWLAIIGKIPNIFRQTHITSV